MSDTAEAACAVEDGSTALHRSSCTGNALEVQKLLVSGANVHTRDKVAYTGVVVAHTSFHRISIHLPIMGSHARFIEAHVRKESHIVRMPDFLATCSMGDCLSIWQQ